MEYRVVLKNPFRQAEVLRQLAGEAPASLWNPLGSTELLRPFAPNTFSVGLTPPAPGPAASFATSLAPAYENADYALYLVSAKGGQDKDYYAVDQRMLVYDRQIKWAYWEPAVATDELEVTGAQLKLICPAASMADINKHITHLNEAMRKYKINTRLRQAHFLAQVAHESDHFRTAREYASGAAYEGRKDLGNTQPGDGKRFRGRGLIQLTGRDVYKKYGAYINKDLTTDAGAKLVEEEPYASDASGWFWLIYKSYAKLNKLADEDNINRISAVVNGGVNGRAERIQFWKNAKKVFGIAEKSAT